MQNTPGKILAALLNDREKSKVWLAEKLNVSHAFIHHLISGRREINLATLEAIRVHLKLTRWEYDELLGAIASKMDGLSPLLSNVRRPFFDNLLVPLTLECFRGVKKCAKATLLSSRSLQHPIWDGSVVFKKDKIFKYDLLVFVGISEQKQLCFSWRRAGPRTSPPQEARIQLPYLPGPSDLKRLEKELNAMRNPVLIRRQVATDYERNPTDNF